MFIITMQFIADCDWFVSKRFKSTSTSFQTDLNIAIKIDKNYFFSAYQKHKNKGISFFCIHGDKLKYICKYTK